MIAINSLVRRKSQPSAVGLVLDVKRNAQLGTLRARVKFGDTTREIPVDDLEPFVSSVDMWEDVGAQRFAGATAFHKLMTYERLRRPPTALRSAFGTARATFYPYQFKPLLKFLENPSHRLLVADDVGLGKTIEAGYVLREWRARQQVDHVLIVVPARLRTKWRDELRQKFDERFDTVGAKEIRGHFRKARGGRDVEPFAWVTSYETLRLQEVADLFEEVQPPIDLAVFDEAHRLRNRTTRQYRAGRAVARAADALLFLTATPIQTKLDDLHTLLDLLEEGRFGTADDFAGRIEANRPIIRASSLIGAGDFEAGAAELRRLEQNPFTRVLAETPVFKELVGQLAVFDATRRTNRVQLQRAVGEFSLTGHLISRTRKMEVMKNWPQREALDLRVTLSADEQAVYDAALEVSLLLYQSQSGFGQQMAALMAFRYTASCIPAAAAFFRERLIELGAMDEDTWSAELGNDVVEDEGLAAVDPGQVNRQRMRALVETVLARVPSAAQDTKLSKLLAAIRTLWEEDRLAKRAPRKVIIFSYFKRTLAYLDRELSREMRLRVIHGDVSLDEREVRITEFLTSTAVNVLLSSEVGGEGIDLQKASVVVNYDLPWNPMVVEQRIGRVDRIGQQAARIIVVNFFTADTVEERILHRLYERIGLFRESIGEIEPIVGKQITELLVRDLRGELTPDEARAQADRTADAIVRNAQDASLIGRSSDALLAADQSFLDEIDRMVSQRRVPLAKELHDLVVGYLVEHHPGYRVDGAPIDAHGTLSLPPEARTALRAWAPTAGTEALSFAGRLEQGGVPITYAADVALRAHRVEFLQARHPLLQFIADQMHARHSQEGRSFALRAVDPSLREGLWLLGVVGVELTTTRPENRFEVGLVEFDSGDVVIGDDATPYLTAILGTCEPIDPCPTLPEDVLLKRRDGLRDALAAHIDRLEQETEQIENRRISARRESWRVTLQRRVEAEEERLARLVERGADELPRRLTRARLDKRQRELNERMLEFAAATKVRCERYDVATALLLVEHA